MTNRLVKNLRPGLNPPIRLRPLNQSPQPNGKPVSQNRYQFLGTDLACRKRPRFVRTIELVQGALALIPQLPADITCIIGVARSGLIPAAAIAATLHLPLQVLDEESEALRPAGFGWRMRNWKHSVGRALVVDDTTGKGRSLAMTKKVIKPILPTAIYASVFCNPEAETKPDLYGESLSFPHLLEWNLFNSIVSTPAAFDFDGVLCHDEHSGGKPGEPNYLPRRSPAYIITGRSELQRRVTEQWLAKWGVEIKKLVMGQWLETPDTPTIVEHKSEAVLSFVAEKGGSKAGGSPYYVESCPHQAKAIADKTGVMTVCPRTAEVFGPEGCWE